MNKHMGTTLDSLFEELGEKEEVELLTQKKVLAMQLRRQMEAERVSKTDLARRMKTSRTEVYNLLDPSDTGVTLATMSRASRALGMRLAIALKPRRTARASKRTSTAHRH